AVEAVIASCGGGGRGPSSGGSSSKALSRVGAAVLRPKRPGRAVPSARPTHTPTVQLVDMPTAQASRNPYEVPVLNAISRGRATARPDAQPSGSGVPLRMSTTYQAERGSTM